MKILIIGGNRFVGLRLAKALDTFPGVDLQILNRTGQAAHVKNAVIHKGDRSDLSASHVDKDWDIVVDFACFKQKEAEASLKYFKSVGRYIFVSTLSVYDLKPNCKEGDFNPSRFDLASPPLNPATYQDGKRRAEAVFAQQSQFPVLSVRFPFIVGPDDYTHRLDFHIDRVLRSDSIFIPFPNVKISLIHSEDAMSFLQWSLDKPHITGPINAASADPISLAGLMGQIELVTGIKPVMATSEKDDNHSPYGIEADCFLSTERMNQAGFTARPIAEWLPGLIGKPSAAKPRFVH